MNHLDKPKSQFFPVSENMLKALNRISILEDFLKDSTKIKYTRFLGDGNKYYIIRIESEFCEEFCITAFFMNGISQKNLNGLGSFSQTFHRSHFGREPCSGCAPVFPMIFTSKNQSGKVVYPSVYGFIF